MSKPFFSIIVPAHNAADHINKCLDSIKMQTFQDYELIVVVDNSNDDTDQIAHLYADKVILTGFGRTAWLGTRALTQLRATGCSSWTTMTGGSMSMSLNDCIITLRTQTRICCRSSSSGPTTRTGATTGTMRSTA